MSETNKSEGNEKRSSKRRSSSSRGGSRSSSRSSGRSGSSSRSSSSSKHKKKRKIRKHSDPLDEKVRQLRKLREARTIQRQKVEKQVLVVAGGGFVLMTIIITVVLLAELSCPYCISTIIWVALVSLIVWTVFKIMETVAIRQYRTHRMRQKERDDMALEAQENA